jgi:hypothetical protein
MPTQLILANGLDQTVVPDMGIDETGTLTVTRRGRLLRESGLPSTSPRK